MHEANAGALRGSGGSRPDGSGPVDGCRVGAISCALLVLLGLAPLDAATFPVNNTNNAGGGSLRAAITNANNNAGADVVSFNIPAASCPGGVCTISLATPLPTLSDQVTVDGTTQAEAIEIDANNSLTAIRITATGCVVRGLVINDYNLRGILVESTASGTTIEGNLIGTNAAGTALANPGVNGILLQSSNNVVGGNSAAARNIIAGNTNGIRIGSNASGNMIQGNYIGTDITGMVALGNQNGVSLDAGTTNTTIGGTTAAERNVLSGNSILGVLMGGAGTTGNVVSGNYIGLAADGLSALPNAEGVRILGGAATNTIGGAVSGAGNVISGSDAIAVRIQGLGTSNNVVQGNLIGTDAGGSVAVPNGTLSSGAVVINNFASSNQIGGSTALERNVISGNRGDGLQLLTGVSANVVQGNWLGVDATGANPLPNQRHGIVIFSDANSPTPTPDNVIGGLNPGEGNVIANHPRKGIAVDGVGPGNQILGNLIGTDPTGTLNMGNGFGTPPPGFGPDPGIDILNNSSAQVRANLVLYNKVGILVRDKEDPNGPDIGPGSLAASSIDNCVVFNDTGCDNTTGISNTFDNNWWGSVDGPSGAGPGGGDSVSADVVFSPFLTSQPAGCPSYAADLSIAKSDSPDPVAAGQALTYTVTVSNNGPGAASGVQVQETLPAAVAFVSTSGCAEDPNGVPTCTLGTIGAGGSAMYSIATVVNPAATGTLTNTATVSAVEPEGAPGDETAVEMTAVLGATDLSIVKTAAPDPVVAGQDLTYTVTVSNAGPEDAVGVQVTDTLPAGVTFVSTSGCAEDPAGVPTCSLGTILAGSSAIYFIDVVVDPQTAGGVTNVATVTATTPEGNPGDETATVTTEVLPPPAVTIPTLGGAGFLALVLLLAVAALAMLRLSGRGRAS